MANIVSFFTTKGGVGKSTLAIHLAQAFSKKRKDRKQRKVVLIDSDPQGSTRDWKNQRKEPGFPVMILDHAHKDSSIEYRSRL